LPDPATPETLAKGLLLYLVADPDHVRGDFLTMVRSAIAGGVTAVQLRCKGRTDREATALARRIREIAGGTLFLVNDRLDIALASAADGVHLGVDDLPLEDARRIAGPDFVIGCSPDSDHAARKASAQGADYLGVGPVFGTSTKSDAGDAIGLTAIERTAQIAGIPIIGIGGIDASTARSVIEHGAVGVALVSAIAMAENPRLAAEQLRRTLAS
jgi:thiamine-phosphate pyrophosphorylase